MVYYIQSISLINMTPYCTCIIIKCFYSHFSADAFSSASHGGNHNKRLGDLNKKKNGIKSDKRLWLQRKMKPAAQTRLR